MQTEIVVFTLKMSLYEIQSFGLFLIIKQINYLEILLIA